VTALRSRLAALLAVAAPALLVLVGTTTVHASSSARIAVTPVVQQHALDCEAAALQMALSVVGISVTQDQLLAKFGDDPRAPVLKNGAPVEWGDPYQSFVGNVNGDFVVTGYSVYYPPIVNAATAEGAAATGREGWQPSQLYAAVAAGHPVVVRVPHLLAAASVGYWTAWDGRQVWYSHRDHAQTLVGYDYGAGTVTLADPSDGQIHTYSMSAFEQAFAVFHSQAIEVSAGGKSPSQAISPTNGSVNVAVQGPDHSLFFYWNVAGAWYGPLGIGGPNSTFSAPSIVAEANGNFDIAMEGPNNTLFMYWDTSGRWYGPLQVGGPGSTWSAPSAAVDQNKHVTVAVVGPSNSMYMFWCVNAQWYGPYGLGAPGSTYSAPNLSLTGGTPLLQAIAQGASAQLQQYQEHGDGSWSGPNAWSSVDSAYSAASTSTAVTLYQASDNSLNQTLEGASTSQVGGTGTTFSGPSVGVFGADTYAVAEGPAHNLNFYLDHGGWGAAVQAAPPGSAYSAPSLAVESSGHIDVAVEGPSDTLFFFWRIGSTWYGPLQVGRAGSAHSSLP
jgi:uncharacterized protein YvpB